MGRNRNRCGKTYSPHRFCSKLSRGIIGTRTLTFAVKRCAKPIATITPILCGLRDSNPQHLTPKVSTLPFELNPLNSYCGRYSLMTLFRSSQLSVYDYSGYGSRTHLREFMKLIAVPYASPAIKTGELSSPLRNFVLS